MVAGATGVTDIDVAIVAYRRWDLTRSCLAHLQAQTVPHRIQLCDNGCDEHTTERVRSEFPEITVVTLERNMPYPVACNAAVAAGNGDLVVMMNNDVDARPDFLERLCAPLVADDRLGSAASVLLAPGETRIDSVGLVADRTLAAFPRLHGRPSQAAGRERPLLSGPAGAAAAFRRAAWQSVGGLDERIPAYLEDLDLALRLRAAHWQTTVAEDAVAVHIGGATFGRRSADQRRRAGYARGYLLCRYGVLRTPGAPRTIATELLVCAGDLAISRDLAATRGRLAGWRGARGLTRRRWPPAEAIDPKLSLSESIALRRASYADA
jgi:N-acetylglucosaminyl-diphospho-decaprenol L-rhamnosyltransferase